MSSGEISRLSSSELSRLRATGTGPADRSNHAPLSVPMYGSRHLSLQLRQMSHTEETAMHKAETHPDVPATTGKRRLLNSDSRKGKITVIRVKPTELLLRDDAAQLNSLMVYQLTSKGFKWKDVKEMLSVSELFDNNSVMHRIVGKSVRSVQRLGNKMPTHLTAQQSAIAYQYAKTLEDAIRVFGSQKLAEQWLCSPCKFLGDDVPLDMIANPVGFQAVKEYLERVEYGVYQ